MYSILTVGDNSDKKITEYLFVPVVLIFRYISGGSLPLDPYYLGSERSLTVKIQC